MPRPALACWPTERHLGPLFGQLVHVRIAQFARQLHPGPAQKGVNGIRALSESLRDRLPFEPIEPAECHDHALLIGQPRDGSPQASLLLSRDRRLERVIDERGPWTIAGRVVSIQLDRKAGTAWGAEQTALDPILHRIYVSGLGNGEVRVFDSLTGAPVGVMTDPNLLFGLGIRVRRRGL